MKLSNFFCILAAALAFSGCKDKKNTGSDSANTNFKEVAAKSSDHKWYYFSENSYTEVDLPQHSPILSLKPWTESLRICDGNVAQSEKGLLLVNHFGVLLFDNGGEPKVIQDSALFSNTTAGNLVFENSVPFFALAKNSFFNKNAASSDSKSETSHVVKLSLENSMFFPVITYGDLKIGSNAEVSGTYFDGNEWFSSIKSSENGRTGFKYIKWKPNGDLSVLPPSTKNGKISISEISKDEYRKNLSPKTFSKAPERLKKLLSSIPADFDFSVALKKAGGASPEYFYGGDQNKNSVGNENEANAILTPDWICAVFGDGTAYFSGSLKGKTLLNSGKTIAFRLPKLPSEYVYGNFCISGDYLAVAWEETDFYKTGRSGFLVVDMAKIFY